MLFALIIFRPFNGIIPNLISIYSELLIALTFSCIAFINILNLDEGKIESVGNFLIYAIILGIVAVWITMVIGLIIEFICKKEEDKKDMPVKIKSDNKTNDVKAAITPSINDVNTLCEEIKKDNLSENSKVTEENKETKINEEKKENEEKEGNEEKNPNDSAKITITNNLAERYIGIGIDKSQLSKPKTIKASRRQIF